MKYECFHLVLMVTHRCNLRCSYCYMGRQSPRSMTPEIGRGGHSTGGPFGPARRRSGTELLRRRTASGSRTGRRTGRLRPAGGRRRRNPPAARTDDQRNAVGGQGLGRHAPPRPGPMRQPRRTARGRITAAAGCRTEAATPSRCWARSIGFRMPGGRSRVVSVVESRKRGLPAGGSPVAARSRGRAD